MIEFKEKLSELLDNAKERLSNPLFFSFIISWCLINWKVAFGVIWYTNDEIKKDLYHPTVFSFIIDNLYSPIWLPLAGALTYTFIIAPISRNVTNVWNVVVNSWGNTKAFQYGKKAPISVEQYYALQEEYKKKEQMVAENINTEVERRKLLDKTQEQLIDLQKQNGELDTRFNEQTKELQNKLDGKTSELHDAINNQRYIKDRIQLKSEMYGYWEVLNPENTAEAARLYLHNADTRYLGERLNFSSFIRDPYNNEVAFRLDDKENVPKYYFNLRADDTNKNLKGYLNFKKAQMKKIDILPSTLEFIDSALRTNKIALDYLDGSRVTFSIQILDGVIVYESKRRQHLYPIADSLSENVPNETRYAFIDSSEGAVNVLTQVLKNILYYLPLVTSIKSELSETIANRIYGNTLPKIDTVIISQQENNKAQVEYENVG